VPAGAGSFFTLEHSHEVLGRFTIQLLGSFVTNDNGRFAAFAADTLFLEAVFAKFMTRHQKTHEGRDSGTKETGGGTGAEGSVEEVGSLFV